MISLQLLRKTQSFILHTVQWSLVKQEAIFFKKTLFAAKENYLEIKTVIRRVWVKGGHDCKEHIVLISFYCLQEGHRQLLIIFLLVFLSLQSAKMWFRHKICGSSSTTYISHLWSTGCQCLVIRWCHTVIWKQVALRNSSRLWITRNRPSARWSSISSNTSSAMSFWLLETGRFLLIGRPSCHLAVNHSGLICLS